MPKATAPAPVATPSSILSDDMFVSDGIIEHPVELADGTTRPLYFRELSAIEVREHFAAENSKDPKVRREAAARLIARSLVEPDGRRALTAQQASRLKPRVSGAIFMAILQIHEILPKSQPAPPVTTENEADDGPIDDIDDDTEVAAGN